MQAERLGVEIEVFLCAVCRHRQVVVAVDTRHGHLLPEVWLSPRRFGQRTRLRSSRTIYFLLVVTCLREKSDSISKLRPKRVYVAKLLDLGGRLRDRPRSEDHARAKPGKDKRPNRCHVRSILMCRCARRLRSWTAYIRSFVSVRPPR